MVKKLPLPRVPLKSQRRPLGQATLLLLDLHYHRLFSRVATLTGWTADGCVWVISWLCHHPWTIAKFLWATFWRAIAFAGFAYLVYDRIYETSATISAPASDPAFPFTFPFSITNNSHVFALRDIMWSCQPVGLKWGNNNEIKHGNLMRGSTSEILPGQTLNIPCGFGGFTNIHEVVVITEVSYTADFFGLFSLRRNVPPTTFTWVAKAANPQWIKGDFAK